RHATGDLEAALVAHERAASFAAFRPTACFNAACACALSGRRDAALAWLERAVAAGFAGAAQLREDADLSTVRDGPRVKALLERLERADRPAAPAAEPVPPRRQLDFWVGRWHVRGPGGRLAGTNVIERTLDGNLIVEHWTSSTGGRGKSMNYWDPSREHWVQVWVTAGGGATVTERRFNGVGMDVEGIRFAPDGAASPTRGSVTPMADGTVRQIIQERDGSGAWATVFEGRYLPAGDEPFDAEPAGNVPSAGDRSLDFWIGTWTVHAGERLAGRNTIEPALNGRLLIEQWRSAGGGRGTSFNFRHPGERRWTQVWVDTSGGIITTRGHLEGGSMRLLDGEHVLATGEVRPFRLTFTPRPDGSVRQLCEESTDGGTTFATWFDGVYRKVPEPAGRLGS
ncbi:MAG: TPR end-of-group domain-containing protein, partial [Planctomycetota bacterium]